jgi:hypothetical protein
MGNSCGFKLEAACATLLGPVEFLGDRQNAQAAKAVADRADRGGIHPIKLSCESQRRLHARKQGCAVGHPRRHQCAVVSRWVAAHPLAVDVDGDADEAKFGEPLGGAMFVFSPAGPLMDDQHRRCALLPQRESDRHLQDLGAILVVHELDRHV